MLLAAIGLGILVSWRAVGLLCHWYYGRRIFGVAWVGSDRVKNMCGVMAKLTLQVGVFLGGGVRFSDIGTIMTYSRSSIYRS